MAVGAFFAVRRRALGRLGRLRLGAAALGVLAGKVGEDEWALVRLARHNLGELADRVQAVEGKIQVSVSEEE